MASRGNADFGGVTVDVSSLDDVRATMKWSLASASDMAAFHSADPTGFFTARDASGARVGCISAVRFGETHAHIGFFIVNPRKREQGIGAALWHRAMRHAHGRVISLDAVQEQVEVVMGSGFKQPAYTQLAFSGAPRAPPKGGGNFPEKPTRMKIVDATSVPFSKLLAYDRRFVPAPREAFLSAWLGTPGHVSVAALSGSGEGAVVGLAVGRPNHDGSRTKLGPVYAATPEIAWLLVHRLLESAPLAAAGAAERSLPDSVLLYVPSANAAAVALAREMGLTQTWSCARMYTTDAPPDVAVGEMFGCASLELG